MPSKKSKKAKTPRTRYGIGEWHGELVTGMSVDTAKKFGEMGGKKANLPCPFLRQSSGALCTKGGGVCSIRLYEESANGHGPTPGINLVTVCPYRFWQDNIIFQHIGQAVLNCETPNIVKEVGFLKSEVAKGSSEPGDKPVGRIDAVLINPADHKQWCAVEIQAVYLSGRSMSTEYAAYKDSETAPVFPRINHRPDFRSSGPKRLMPQLQIKVPSLRRWGKKMVVVVDEAFFASLGEIRKVEHISNADIAWVVVGYDLQSATLKVRDTVFTTLESSVEGLTAGTPTSLEAFQSDLETILKKKPNKVVTLRRNES